MSNVFDMPITLPIIRANFPKNDQAAVLLRQVFHSKQNLKQFKIKNSFVFFGILMTNEWKSQNAWVQTLGECKYALVFIESDMLPTRDQEILLISVSPFFIVERCTSPNNPCMKF